MLKVKELTYLHDSRSTDGVSNLSFHLGPGESLALMGASGSGKTTTINLLCERIRPQSGEIIKSADTKIAQAQFPHNEEQTLFEFLSSLLLEYDDDQQKENRIRSVLSFLELTNEIHSSFLSLSHGQRQRSLLASALIFEPKVVLLDEVFVHLDPWMRSELIAQTTSLLKEKGVALIWVTHFLREAFSFCDKLAILNFGKLEQIDSPLNIYSDPKNSFVAKFVGLRNALITNVNEDGSYRLLGQKFTCLPAWAVKGKELVAYLPNSAFKLHEQGQFRYQSELISFNGESFLYRLKKGEQKLWLRSWQALEDKKLSFDLLEDQFIFSKEL